MADMKFLHTADLQLGMTRYFLDADAQARYDSARITAITTMGKLAQAQGCAFIVVAGDVFESNNLSRRIVGRSLQAFREIQLPVFLLPGNHDPLEPGSIYESSIYKREWPENLLVLRGEPLEVPDHPGVSVHGAPWTSKAPLGDPLSAVLSDTYDVDPHAFNILVGHGAVDSLAPDPLAPGIIALGSLQDAVEAGRFAYVALGDRHSTTDLGRSGRIWYSGSPEVTAFRDTAAGNALVVTVSSNDLNAGSVGSGAVGSRAVGSGISVSPHRIGTWNFLRVARELHSAEDVAELDDYLVGLPNPALTAIRHELSGALSLGERAQLEEVLERHSHVFGSIGARDSDAQLVTSPSPDDLASLQLTGYAAAALEELQEQLLAPSQAGGAAAGALQLLHRIIQEQK